MGSRLSMLATTGSTISRQAIQLLTTSVLARFILPNEFGLIAVSATVISVAQCFRDFGIASAVVQKTVCAPEFLSSLLMASVALGSVLAALIGGAAPFAAEYFGQPEVAPIMSALGFSVFLSSLGNVQLAVLEREGRFPTIAAIEVVSHVAAAAASISLGIAGAGPWALVAQALVVSGGRSIAIAIIVRIPLRGIRIAHLREIGRQSWYYLLTTVMSHVIRNFDVILIGRHVGVAAVGAYSLATQMCQLPGALVSTPLARVLFPKFCRISSEKAQMAEQFHRASAVLATVMYPVLVFISILSYPITWIVLGERWPTVAVIAPIIAINFALQSTLGLTSIVYQATARTDIMFYNSMGYAIISCAFLIVASAHGLVAMAMACLVATAAYFWPAHHFPMRILGSSVRNLLHSLSRPLLCTAAMAVAVCAIHIATRRMPALATLACSGLGGALVYVVFTARYNNEAFTVMVTMLKPNARGR